MMNVCIIGTGYVGLTTGACLAYLGHNVTCVDTDAAKIRLLENNGSPIFEPGIHEMLAAARDHLTFTTDCGRGVSNADVIFIAVGTPPGENGIPDLQYVRAAAQSIGRHYHGDFTVVVNKSTVPIGSGNWVASLLAEYGKCFGVASNPEFLREGSAIHDSLYPDRVVIGADSELTRERLGSLYRPILEQTFTPPAFLPRPEGLAAVPLLTTDLASAELIKYAANAFLALKISYINEIGVLADRVGADIVQIAKGIGLDQRIGHRFLSPGIGWGGSCFGKDTAALVATAAEYRIDMPIVKAARDANTRQREYVVDKLLNELKILKGRTIGLLGLAFKPNTDDLREAPAIDIARLLIARGCRVKVHDPVALERFGREYPHLDVVKCETALEAAAGSDALVLVTEWQQYRELDWPAIGAAMRTPIVLDGRHALDPAILRKIGFRYFALRLGTPIEVSAPAFA